MTAPPPPPASGPASGSPLSATAGVSFGQSPAGGTGGRLRLALGLVFILPAAIGLLISYVGPTFWTIRASFRDIDILDGGAGASVGTENYGHLTGMGEAIGFALSLAFLPLLTVIIVAPVLAYSASVAGRPGRWAARLAFAVPMVLYAPAVLAAGWLLDYGRDAALATPSGARSAVTAAVWLSSFGLVCGFAVTAYLAALYRRAPGGRTWPAALAVGGILIASAVAVALQSFAYPAVLGGGGPQRSTTTPILGMFAAGFRNFNFGVAAAQATLLLIILAVLGLGVTLLVIFTRLRMEVDLWGRPSSRATPSPVPPVVGGVVLGVGLVIVLAITLYGLWPWLSHLGGSTSGREISGGTLFVNTWFPPLVSTVVGVTTAALAGFGIGGLRPLGQWSELLLLPFAPWLFVGLGPLSLANFLHAEAADQVNTFVGLIPPVWVVIPALFVFTLLGRGQEQRWRELVASGVSPGQSLVRALLPALPMLVVVGGAVWLVQAQDVLWPYVVALSPDAATGPLWVMAQLSALYRGGDVGLGAAFPIALVIVGALVLGALQVFYLDRVALRTGPGDADVTPTPEPQLDSPL